MNYEQIRAIATVLRESPTLTEIEVRHYPGATLRLRRPSPKPLRTAPSPAPVAPSVMAAENPLSQTTASLSSPDAGPGTRPGTVPLTAAVVGVFRALGQEALVSVGTVVKSGQIIGHIEAMRLLNDCFAPESGTVASVRVEEGQPVEYGQLLFEIASTE